MGIHLSGWAHLARAEQIRLLFCEIEGRLDAEPDERSVEQTGEFRRALSSRRRKQGRLFANIERRRFVSAEPAVDLRHARQRLGMDVDRRRLGPGGPWRELALRSQVVPGLLPVHARTGPGGRQCWLPLPRSSTRRVVGASKKRAQAT